jgi:hypothetical protein
MQKQPQGKKSSSGALSLNYYNGLASTVMAHILQNIDKKLFINKSETINMRVSKH